LTGHDILASAQTGSGKTVGFLLPLIAAVAKNRRDTDINNSNNNEGKTSSPAALILAPTRELALQIDLEIEKLTFGAPPPSTSSTATATRWSACCYGGATARPQLEALASGVEILVATPGRLVDFLDRDLVSLRNCKFLVLDEADRMLDMGFQPQLRKIVEQKDMPSRLNGRQTLLFSATFPKALRDIAQKSYLRKNFAKVAVGKVGATNKSVEQRILKINGDGSKRQKLEELLNLLLHNNNDSKTQNKLSPPQTIVFTNKKHVASWITKMLSSKSNGIKCSQIHGGRTQGQRETALKDFREGRVNVLVATDAVSRGIDIPDVEHVIQFDLPFSVNEFESYTHRIGRTGRAGKTGIATSFYVPGHQPKVGNADIWTLIKKSFDESEKELPEWFYEERGETSQNRSRSKYDKTGGVRPPHQGSGQRVTSPRSNNYSATASNASGFKKRQLAGRNRNSR